MNNIARGAVQLETKNELRSPTGSQENPVRMKFLHKLALPLVIVAGLAFATPAQARWRHHHYVVVGYGAPYYYGPAYYGYPYYAPYYGYYGPSWGGGYAFGGHYWHGGHGHGGYGHGHGHHH